MNTTHKVSAITLAFGQSMNKGQLAFASSIAFETLPLIVADPKFKFAAFAREVEEASDYSISAKTVANCAVLANQLQQKYGEKIGSYVGGFNKSNVSDFVNFITNEVKATTYKLTLEDLTYMCKGEQSMADRRAAAAAALKAAALALESAKLTTAAAELTATADAATAAAAKAVTDAAAVQAKATADAATAEAQAVKAAQDKEASIKLAAQLTADNDKAREELALSNALIAAAAAENEALRKEQESFAVKVTVNADGSPNIVFALNMSPAFLHEVAKQIKAAANSMAQQQKMALAA